MKKSIIIIVLILIVGIVVFFSMFWPLNSEKDLKGTIGGVQKAKKHVEQNIEESDIFMDEDDYNKFIQTAEWQNLAKNESFIKAVKSGEFQEMLGLHNLVSQIIWTSQEFNKFKNMDVAANISSEEDFKAALRSAEVSARFRVWANKNMNNLKALFGADFQNWKSAINLGSFLASQKALKTIWASDFNGSQKMQSLMLSKDFQKWLSNDFQNLSGVSHANGFMNSFLNIFSNDFQELAGCSQDFNKLLHSADFEKAMVRFSDVHNNVLMSSDANDITNSADYQSSIGVWSMSENLNMFLNSDALKSSTGTF